MAVSEQATRPLRPRSASCSDALCSVDLTARMGGQIKQPSTQLMMTIRSSARALRFLTHYSNA